jgi:hypothetical protein
VTPEPSLSRRTSNASTLTTFNGDFQPQPETVRLSPGLILAGVAEDL